MALSVFACLPPLCLMECCLVDLCPFLCSSLSCSYRVSCVFPPHSLLCSHRVFHLACYPFFVLDSKCVMSEDPFIFCWLTFTLLTPSCILRFSGTWHWLYFFYLLLNSCMDFTSALYTKAGITRNQHGLHKLILPLHAPASPSPHLKKHHVW